MKFRHIEPRERHRFAVSFRGCGLSRTEKSVSSVCKSYQYTIIQRRRQLYSRFFVNYAQYTCRGDRTDGLSVRRRYGRERLKMPAVKALYPVPYLAAQIEHTHAVDGEIVVPEVADVDEEARETESLSSGVFPRPWRSMIWLANGGSLSVKGSPTVHSSPPSDSSWSRGARAPPRRDRF